MFASYFSAKLIHFVSPDGMREHQQHLLYCLQPNELVVNAKRKCQPRKNGVIKIAVLAAADVASVHKTRDDFVCHKGVAAHLKLSSHINFTYNQILPGKLLFRQNRKQFR